MIWTYTEHTHPHSRTQTCAHTRTHTVYTLTCIQFCAHTRAGRCVFTVSSPYARSHSHIYTNTLYKSMCAPTPTHSLLIALSLSLSVLTLTHSHSHSHTLLHVNIVDKPSLNLSLHILLWPIFFGRQTMRNDSKWKMYDMFPCKATQF